MSQGGGGGSNLPSYYDEGSYDEEEEYESEQDDLTGSAMQRADKEGQPRSTFKRAKKRDGPPKDFDPRTDKLLDIASDDYLMESLQHFKPPAEQSVTDKSMSVFGERQDGKSHTATPKVIAGVKMQNMVDNAEDVDEIRQLQYPLATSTPAGADN